MKRKPTFELFRDDTGQWRWRLRAANNEILCQSEAYTRKTSARRSIKGFRLATIHAVTVED